MFTKNQPDQVCDINASKKLELIFNNVNDAIYIHDNDGNIIDVNETACKTLDYTKKEIMSRGIAKLDTPEFAAKIPERVQLLLKTGQAVFESVHVKKDGGTMPVEVSAKIIDYGGTQAILSVVRDITERKTAEEKIKKEEQKYSSLFKSMMEGFALHEIILDKKGKPVDYRFLAVNPAFEKITGLKEKDVLNKTVSEILPKTEKAWIEKYGTVATTGEPTSFEMFSGTLNKNFKITVFSPRKNEFATLFEDISEKTKETEREKKLLEEAAEKNKKLEKFIELTSGRELKMIELKNKIKELELKLGANNNQK